jgi:hypothetical protein
MRLNEQFLAHISVASVCALLFIWVLPNTIALRHVLLGAGCISGACLIGQNWRCLYPFRLQLIPLYAIGSLFLWVGIHYYFFSLNPNLELSEISSLWARTFAGFIMAIGFGIAFVRYDYLRKYFYGSIFFVPIINVLAYIYACYLYGGLLEPKNFVFTFLFAKIEAAYFGGLAAAVAVANIIYLIKQKRQQAPYLPIALYLTGLLLVLVSVVVSNTKNGVAITLALCLLLVMIVTIHSLLNFADQKKLGFVIAAFILLLAGGVWEGHQSFAYKGWDTVLQDVKVGWDIDRNQQWQRGEGTVPTPLNSLGMPAALNTYSRSAWAAVGLRLISQNPLGYGSINQSFDRLQTRANIYHEFQGQVHSGWIDLGLAFGIPAFIICFASLFGTILLAARNLDQLSLIALFIAGMLIPFGCIAEVTYKQYFESLIFFMTFLAILVAIKPKDLLKKVQ